MEVVLMKEVLYGLNNNKIISEKDIYNIKQYIIMKYPNITSKERSVILANTVHRIIDTNIHTFSEEYRKDIQYGILQKAIKNNNFSISAYEVLCQCIEMDEDNEAFQNSLISWINENQSINIPLDKFNYLINELKQNDVTDENQSIDEIDNTSSSVESFKDYNNINCKIMNFKKYINSTFKYILYILQNDYKKAALIWTLIAILIYLPIFNMQKASSEVRKYNQVNNREIMDSLLEPFYKNKSYVDLEYIEVDKDKLQKWLIEKNSLLADEPYFSSILNAAKEYNVNPLLMISITGQEQSFVPRDTKNASKIANNPFNVYGSWVVYNTDINDSAKIAAKTLASSIKKRPADIDPIQWINTTYAEDKNWWKGTKWFLEQLTEKCLPSD